MRWLALTAATTIVATACAPAYEAELEETVRNQAAADLACERADIELDVSTGTDRSDAHVRASGCGHALPYHCYRRPAASRTWHCTRVSF